MTAPDLPFSAAEYDRRIAKVRASMTRRGIDVLVVTDPANMHYLTGYDGWSFYVHQAVLLGLDGQPVWWGRLMDGNGARRTVWMDETRICTYPDSFIQADDCHPMEDLAVLLSEMGHGMGRIGVEMESYYYTARAHSALTAALDKATFLDATSLVNWVRLRKSDAELAFMRRAARISELAIAKAIELTEPGLHKNVLVAAMTQTALAGEGDIWGDYPAIVPMVPSGADASAPHLTWNGAPLRSGEATFIEQSGCYRRYHAPLCRTVFLGDPPDDIRRAADAVEAGLEAGINAARAGNRAADVAIALNDVLAKAGIERSARAGYAVGLSYPPDWGEHTVSLRDTDETVLEPGMTFHFMPGLWMDSWGIETTETILIRDDGPAEALCNVDRALVVKP